jgi:hypothetical protein
VVATVTQLATVACNVGGSSAIGIASVVSTTLKSTVASASAVGDTAATGLRLAANSGDGAAIGLLAQLQRIFGVTAGNAIANGVQYRLRSSNDIVPGALVGLRPEVDTARAERFGEDRPVQTGFSRPPRIARTTR